MSYRENQDETDISKQLSRKLLSDKLAAQERIIERSRHEINLLNSRLSKATSNLKKLKSTMEKTIHARTRQLEKTNHNLQKELTDRLEVKADLQNSEAQFRALVESSADHIFILDRLGIFIFSNNQVRQFDLCHGQDLVGKKLEDVYPSQVCRLYREKLQEVFENGEVVRFYHETSGSHDVEYHWDMLYPILRKNHIWAVGGICRDISEQKHIEKQLFQAQKMEALGTLVAGVAHEINNPINLILFNIPLFEKMWIDMLPILDKVVLTNPNLKIGGLTHCFLNENLKRLISDMEMAAQRVARIVTGLKDFARKSNPAMKSDVQVNLAVENATRLAAATLKESMAVLTLDLEPDLPLIQANIQNLEQIILNLIINALQSITHDHGRVSIRTRSRSDDQTILIQVADNGRGINPAVSEKIFDPFVTDRQANGGTGLGLSVSYNLVKAHKGDIFFQTKPGEGTVFSVVLPRSAMWRPFRVMVVDDDETFRKLLTDALSGKTNSVVEGYSNGAEALIRLGSYPPDLLVLDMFMPEIDGLGVCRAIKKGLGLDLNKVFIVTGFPDHPHLYEAARMGFNQIFKKPLLIEDFIDIIRKNLDGINSAKNTHSDR